MLLKNLHGLDFSLKCEKGISLAIMVAFGTYVILILFFIIVNPIKAGRFSGGDQLGGGGVRANPPLVSQLLDPKNSKTQFFQTDMVLSFHLSS